MLAVTLRENALTTLDALKTSLGIDPEEEDAQRDATLVQLINAASAWLETQLGRKLGKSTYRQKYCGTGTQMLSLEQYPIVSVERITDTFTGETITDFDFNETGEIGVLFREDGWTYRGHIGGLAYDYIATRKYLEVQYAAHTVRVDGLIRDGGLRRAGLAVTLVLADNSINFFFLGAGELFGLFGFAGYRFSGQWPLPPVPFGIAAQGRRKHCWSDRAFPWDE